MSSKIVTGWWTHHNKIAAKHLTPIRDSTIEKYLFGFLETFQALFGYQLVTFTLKLSFWKCCLTFWHSLAWTESRFYISNVQYRLFLWVKYFQQYSWNTIPIVDMSPWWGHLAMQLASNTKMSITMWELLPVTVSQMLLARVSALHWALSGRGGPSQLHYYTH